MFYLRIVCYCTCHHPVPTRHKHHIRALPVPVRVIARSRRRYITGVAGIDNCVAGGIGRAGGRVGDERRESRYRIGVLCVCVRAPEEEYERTSFRQRLQQSAGDPLTRLLACRRKIEYLFPQN